MDELREWIQKRARTFRPYTEKDLEGKGLDFVHRRVGEWELLTALSLKFFGEPPDKL